MKSFFLLLVLPLALVAALGFALGATEDDSPDRRVVRVERGDVVRHAVAVGRIEPQFEIPVTASRGGVVTARHVRLGQKVERGAPLVEVRPVLTDLQRLQAERALLGAREAEETVEEFVEGENVMGWAMRLLQGGDSLDRMRRGAERARASAEEQLELLLDGRAEIEGKVIDYVIRAPIEGHVLQLRAEPGQPVVPASTFGSGSVLLYLADMDRPVFRGTVDEIDVGRLHEGMPATISIGALPAVSLTARLIEISLRANDENGAVTFDVKLAVDPPEDFVLRSGYSAVAYVEIERAEDVPVLPERVVRFRGGAASVLVADGDGGTREVAITTGTSDGLSVAIVDGLEVGDEVLEAAGD